MAVHELPIPPDAHTAQLAGEILRGWMVDDRLQCSVLPGAFPEPFGWGILLADLAHHVADALAGTPGVDRGRVLSDIAGVQRRAEFADGRAHRGLRGTWVVS